MVNDSQKHQIIKQFFIPDELKDDIVYCQRSLRDCVKVHQHFVQQYKHLSGIQQVQVKQYLLELEDEMQAIGNDQSGLVQDLRKRLKHFLRKTAIEQHVEVGDELANGYVAWVLSSHYELQGAPSYVPRAVSERLNETQLYQKYRLEPSAISEAGRVNPAETKLRKKPVLQPSLLKPKAQRGSQIVGSQQKKLSLSPPSSTPSTPPPLPPPLPAIVKMPPSTVGSKRKVSPEQPIHAKMLRSRTANMVLVKPELAKIKQEPVEHEPGNDSEESSQAIAIPESAAVKRGRSNLLQALGKVKSSQKTNPPTSTNRSSTGRSNRPAGVTSNASAGHRSPSLCSSDSSNSRASTPGPLTAASVTGSRKPPAEATNTTSDESSNERVLPPLEELPVQPCSIEEMDQYSFLKQYGLYTIEDSNLLKGRKNERKRRSCCSTERKDFHYGRFDYFEQQLYIMQKRRQGANKRLLYIATSAEKANTKRNPWPNGVLTPPPPPLLPAEPSLAESLTAASSAKAINCERIEPENKMCFVCNTVGSTDTLSACTECCNIYHLSCHVNEDEKKDEKEAKVYQNLPAAGGDDGDGVENGNHSAVQLLPQRDNLCPICLPLADGSKHKK